MLFKLATLFVIAATTHLEQAGKNQVQWIYDSGPNKGYLCALMEQDGTHIDVYLPAATADSQATHVTVPKAEALTWSHFKSEKAAVNAVAEYCPVSISVKSEVNKVTKDTGETSDK